MQAGGPSLTLVSSYDYGACGVTSNSPICSFLFFSETCNLEISLFESKNPWQHNQVQLHIHSSLCPLVVNTAQHTNSEEQTLMNVVLNVLKIKLTASQQYSFVKSRQSVLTRDSKSFPFSSVQAHYLSMVPKCPLKMLIPQIFTQSQPLLHSLR